jgi:5-methylcytosine-specific restriction endonuclease McrA
MKYTDQILNSIYDKTDGCCHICHKKISFSNYGIPGSKGAWHVDHSVATVRGGSNRFSNLMPACIPCNTSKGAQSTKSVRLKNNKMRAPLSAQKKQEAKAQSIFSHAAVGGCIGLLFGPLGGLVGSVIGGLVGHDAAPKR